MTGAAKQAFFLVQDPQVSAWENEPLFSPVGFTDAHSAFNKFMAEAQGANSQGLKFLWKIMFNPWTLLEFHAGIIQNRTSGENHPK